MSDLLKMAFQSIIDSGLKKKERQNKALVDEVSAIILQSFYNNKNSIHNMVLPIIAYGDPLLKNLSEAIQPNYPELKQLMKICMKPCMHVMVWA